MFIFEGKGSEQSRYMDILHGTINNYLTIGIKQNEYHFLNFISQIEIKLKKLIWWSLETNQIFSGISILLDIAVLS